MIWVAKIGTIIVSSWVFIYTLSYAKWTWSRKNILGAIMIILLGAAAFIFPIYSLFFREG